VVKKTNAMKAARRSTVRLMVGLLAFICLVACGNKKFDIRGTWVRGGISGDHSGSVVMTLTPTGSSIIGVVCRSDAGHLIFRDRPVKGTYPWVEFDYFGDRIRAQIVDDDTITAVVGGASWFFNRTSAADYDTCAATGP
jgi:hypothetical protein